MKSQAGFTLIEAMTAGIVSTLLAGAVLSLMQMSGKETSESLTRQKIALYSRVVSEQIHTTARKAYFVRSYNEPAWPPPDEPLDALTEDLTAQTGLIFYDRDRLTIIGGYRLHTSDDGVTTLFEYKDGGWQVFNIGNETITMISNQIFSISQNRRHVTFDARLNMTQAGVAYQHANPREIAFCRNTSP